MFCNTPEEEKKIKSLYAQGTREFTGFNLNKADLIRANLSGANLTGASVSSLSIKGATLGRDQVEQLYNSGHRNFQGCLFREC